MKPVIVWFRQDLRVADQRALAAAVATGQPVIPVYVLDDETPGMWKRGAASRWWLNRSLASLDADLRALGSRLILRKGRARDVLLELAVETDAKTIFCQAAYEPWASAAETDIHSVLAADGLVLKRMAGALLKRPDELRTKSGEPFRVYSPFWRALSAAEAPARPEPAPDRITTPAKWPKSDTLAAWGLHPTKPDWSTGLAAEWTPGETGARGRLDRFLATALPDYSSERNRPDRPGTSKLSPHLHFGEISPATCWYEAKAAADVMADHGANADKGLETFLKELVWREFSAHLLVHWPTLPDVAFRPGFEAFPWADDPAGLRAWQRGLTGFPIVDAGMRELFETGWMHNRVRMITASFLIKDLLIPWQAGEAWFWDTLVDADLANNAASWQWVAGCGADAAPYFRIFNPVTQGLKFDPDGAYVRRFVPELGRLPADYIHEPWNAPPHVLAVAGITLGTTYPHPMVDHAKARAKALAAFEVIKST
jgi:deoxyribodipyrimidine photo-lyase